jgi:hypothetical protein
MERIVAENWGVLMSAPVAFVAALGLGAAVGWIVVGLIYNQRLTHYQELIANYRDVLDEKLPSRALRPFPIKRSKQMSFGLVLIFVGLSAAVAGAVLISLDRSPSPTKTSEATNVAPKNLTVPTSPINIAASSAPRHVLNRTAGELFALYEGRTMLQADQLIEPYKGKWIEAQGGILQVIPNGTMGTTVVLKDGEKFINCQLDQRWNAQLLKLANGDQLKITGKIGPSQNGQQLYLLECEII